jgi:outer membrane biosynthesis protein TonB
MSDEDKQPSLEPPKLFGRRKRDVPADSEPDTPEPPAAAVPEPEPTPEPEVLREPEPAPQPARQPAPEPTRPARAPLPEERAPAAEEAPVARSLATGAPLFADEVAPEADDVATRSMVEVRDPEPLHDDLHDDQHDDQDDDWVEQDDEDEAADGRRARSRRVPRGPVLTGYPASALTGLLVGLLMVGLTVGSLRACEGIRGTSTCGGPGLLLLVIILVVLVMVGQVLLRAFRVPDPGSTSFLAVGLIAVVALLFLIDVILNWQMVIVIPLVGLVTFLLSHWVTTAFVEPTD